MRILAICQKCHTQYDVSGQKPGDNLHCRCGAVLSMPQTPVRDARVVRCPSCGAVRNTGGGNCEYCGARFSAADKGWGSMCPACFCRLPLDGQFCVECGLKINPQKLEAAGSELLCPRCQCNLRTRKLEQLEIHECPSCAGMWLPVETFENICKSKETLAMASRGLSAKRSRLKFELTTDEQVKYIPCPQCKNLMNRHNFAGISGVIIDTCRDCGIWLDNQELNRICQFIEGGGLDKAREVEAREQEHSTKMRSKTVVVLPLGGTDLAGTPFTRGPSGGDVLGPVLVRAVREIAWLFLK